jgi:hypothetical protein
VIESDCNKIFSVSLLTLNEKLEAYSLRQAMIHGTTDFFGIECSGTYTCGVKWTFCTKQVTTDKIPKFREAQLKAGPN